jgi:hypothetical protein
VQRLYWIYAIAPEQARRLTRAGIDAVVLDGREPGYRDHLAGIAVRLGTLDPGRPWVRCLSVAPPTATLIADGVLGPPRAWHDSQRRFAPLPEALVVHLIESYGRRESWRESEPPPPPEIDAEYDPVGLFLHQIKQTGSQIVEHSSGWLVQCPIHCDRNPSLSVSRGADGRLLLNCFACGSDPETFRDIMEAVGLRVRHAFPMAEDPGRRPAGLTNLRRTAWMNPEREMTPRELDRWRRRDEECRRALDLCRSKRRELAGRLGVSVASLIALGVGWRNDVEPDDDGGWVGTDRWAWTFPESDGRERVVGLLRRYEDPGREKRALYGGRRGLYLPAGWRDREGPLLLAEGASDTAAAWDAGYATIGRPQAHGTTTWLVEQLATLLADDPRRIVVVADEDPSGTGREGAEELARRLTDALDRPVDVLPPLPPGVKDLRELLTNSPPTNAEDADA